MTRQLRSDWQRTILVCRKCSKKLDGGFGAGGKRSLANALRKRLAIGKGRRQPLGIVETGCLGVCPKRAVMLIDAAAPARWRVVAEGADIDSLLAELGLQDQAA